MNDVPRPDWSELLEKLLRLKRALPDAQTLVLRRQASLTWLFGCRAHVPNTLDAACFDAVIDLEPEAPTVRIVANRIEAPRLADTELAGLDAYFDVLPWWTPRSASWPRGTDVVTDLPYPDARDAGAAVAAVRRRLLPQQARDLTLLCEEAAQVTTDALAQWRPSMSEYEAAGVVAGQLLEHGMDPIVLMVASARRMPLHRHPLPTTEPLGRRGMVVFCARSYGLVASVTRIVSFAPLTTQDLDGYRAILEVEGEFLDQTRPGRRIGDVLAAAVPSYATHGFDADEWHRHHQGGFSGWEPREFPAAPFSHEMIDPDSVVAWNPSGNGWKVEDTALVTNEGARPLVHDPRWPIEQVRGRRRPGILEV